MSARTSFISPGQAIAAGRTAVYKGQLVDENGAAVPASSISAVTLSIVDTTTGAVINGVDETNILNTDRGAVDSQGNLVVTLLPGDTAIVTTGDQNERRSLVVDWTYSGGKLGGHQVNFIVEALAGR